MGRIKDEDYAYSTARIRAIETKLIDRNRMDRLIEVAHPSDALKFLIESGYGTGHANSEKDAVNNSELIFDAELKKVYELLLEILPDPQLAYLFMRRYDYLNAKLILKGEFLEIDIKNRLSSMGTVEPMKLNGYINDRNYKEMPEIFGMAIEESIKAFNQTRDPQNIDFILDKASYENMLADANQYEDPFVIDLIKRLIDVANIRIFIRAKNLNQSEGFIKRALVEGGNISLNSLVNIAGQNIEKLMVLLKQSGHDKLSSELSKALESNNKISEVDLALDDYIIEFLKPSKFVVLGIDPVIAYLFFKETEIKNARLIITGLVNKIPHEIIRERLRLGYA